MERITPHHLTTPLRALTDQEIAELTEALRNGNPDELAARIDAINQADADIQAQMRRAS